MPLDPLYGPLLEGNEGEEGKEVSSRDHESNSPPPFSFLPSPCALTLLEPPYPTQGQPTESTLPWRRTSSAWRAAHFHAFSAYGSCTYRRTADRKRNFDIISTTHRRTHRRRRRRRRRRRKRRETTQSQVVDQVRSRFRSFDANLESTTRLACRCTRADFNYRETTLIDSTRCRAI